VEIGIIGSESVVNLKVGDIAGIFANFEKPNQDTTLKTHLSLLPFIMFKIFFDYIAFF